MVRKQTKGVMKQRPGDKAGPCISCIDSSGAELMRVQDALRMQSCRIQNMRNARRNQSSPDAPYPLSTHIVRGSRLTAIRAPRARSCLALTMWAAGSQATQVGGF